MIGTYRLILEVLTRAQRRRFALLIGLMLVMGVTDLAGVALILPFLAVLSNPAAITNRPALAWLNDWLGFGTTFAFLQFLGVLVFVLVMVGIAVKAVTFYQVNHFARETALTLGLSRLRRYLSRPYDWFLMRHSADLGKSVLQEINEIVIGSISPAVRVIANAILLAALSGLLLYVEPVGALIIGCLLGLGFGLIYLRIGRSLTTMGLDRRRANTERHQVTGEVLGGIKEVKMLGLEDAYLRRFIDPSRRVARYQATISLIGEMPRYALEALSFGGMLLVTLWLMWTRAGDVHEVVPVIGAFAFAGLKLMPVVQMLFRDFALMRFGKPALEALRDDLDGDASAALPPDRDAGGPTIPLRHELRLEGVTYRYPGTETDVLHGLDVAIAAGSAVGFVGTTGAGKTTAMDIVLGLIAPREGTLTVDGTVIDAANLRDWQRGIGFVPQTIHLIDDTIAANIARGIPAAEIDHDQVRECARLASLTGFVEGLPLGFETTVGDAGVRISGGQRQRIGIARALYRDPQILVFDEATSALDTVTERAVMEAVGALRGERTVLMVSHRLSTVAKCDTIFLLDHGRLADAGSQAELVARSAAFRTLLAAAE